MADFSVFDDIVENKLLDLNTAFIAKVIKVSGSTADIQPLSMLKSRGTDAIKPSVLKGVPIIHSARYRITLPEEDTTLDYVSIKLLKSGDIVFCVCADRDISETKKGIMSVPQIGHHSKSDAVIVGNL